MEKLRKARLFHHPGLFNYIFSRGNIYYRVVKNA